MGQREEDAAVGCLIGTVIGFTMWGIIIFCAVRFNAMNFSWKIYTTYVFTVLIAFIIWSIRDKRRDV